MTRRDEIRYAIFASRFHTHHDGSRGYDLYEALVALRDGVVVYEKNTGRIHRPFRIAPPARSSAPSLAFATL